MRDMLELTTEVYNVFYRQYINLDELVGKVVKQYTNDFTTKIFLTSTNNIN